MCAQAGTICGTSRTMSRISMPIIHQSQPDDLASPRDIDDVDYMIRDALVCRDLPVRDARQSWAVLSTRIIPEHQTRIVDLIDVADRVLADLGLARRYSWTFCH